MGFGDCICIAFTTGSTAWLSALQLIIGMAIKKYGYVPGKRSGIPKQIAEDLDSVGLEITDDTVRAFLQEAAESVDLNRIGNIS